MLQHGTISISPLTDADAGQLAVWRRSLELKRLTGPGPFLPTAADEPEAATSTHLPFGIRQTNSEALIGYIALSNISWSNGTADLGVFIADADNQGKHFGTDAISAILNYAFDELNLHRVQLDVVDYNERAIRTYRRLGFTQEGSRRQHGARDGRRYDVLLFGILAPEWRARANDGNTGA